MSERAARRERKAGRLVQLMLLEQGTAGRVLKAYQELKSPFLNAEITDHVKNNAWTLESVALEARQLLESRGLDLRDVQITAAVSGNKITLQADADEMSIARARRAASRRSA